MSTAIYMGMMSGTSMDAVDAVLVTFPTDHSVQLLASISRPWPDDLRQSLLDLCHPGEQELYRLARLDGDCGDFFAATAAALMQEYGVRGDAIAAIGSHGQTIRHEPGIGHSLQIGDPNRIAEVCACPVVADFRRRDLAAGGQGAPLVPAFHAALLRQAGIDRCVLNLGGMANITWLDGRPERAVSGYDTGPGNVLIDTWMQERHHLPYDPQGRHAAAGHIDDDMLQLLLQHPYFAQSAPKSVGRETFHLNFIEQTLTRLARRPDDTDILRTLTRLTAVSVADCISAHGEHGELILCGGGVHNLTLQADLGELLPGFKLSDSDAYGIPAQWMEAMAFAWLARARLERQPGNLAAVTGARGGRCLGALYAP